MTRTEGKPLHWPQSCNLRQRHGKHRMRLTVFAYSWRSTKVLQGSPMIAVQAHPLSHQCQIAAPLTTNQRQSAHPRNPRHRSRSPNCRHLSEKQKATATNNKQLPST